MTKKSWDDPLFQSIADNYAEIRENIEKAAARAGRSPAEIRFMGVTKTVAPVYINHAVSLGVDLIGENKVQELLSKLPYLTASPEKHLIGHLQSNKVRKIVGEVSMIQSADSIPLLAEISLRAGQAGLVTDVLLEVNVGREASKTGIAPEVAAETAAAAAELPGIRLRGLMAVPPFEATPQETRGYFQQMYRMFSDLRSRFPGMDTLSLGMSGDYEAAIEEGSTLIRVGSALFGMRRY